MLDELIVSRIDRLVSCLEGFFDFSLPTLHNQIKTDMKYIGVICSFDGLKHRDYIDYYKNQIREKYGQNPKRQVS